MTVTWPTVGGVRDPMTRSDVITCERIVRRHASTLALASYFLPARKRRAAFAFYALRRTTEDLFRNPPLVTPKSLTHRLQLHKRELAEAIAGRPRGAVFREIRWAIREFDIPSAAPYEVIAGVARWWETPGFRTWDELRQQCEEIATAPGEICIRVFGVRGGASARAGALSFARTLGAAAQVTHILRHAGDDARANRCYLPGDDMARCGIDPEEIANSRSLARDPRWERLMTLEIARTRELYEQSLAGISLLAADVQRCAAACAIGCAAVLNALDHAAHESDVSRASVGPLARLGILWDAWRFKERRAASA